jgi:thiamine-phosphate pyrophosphorylase
VDVEIAESRGWSPVDLARALIDGGARLLQLRAKKLSGRDLLALARELAGLAHAAGASVIVNDRADVARLAGADGVHVGQDDLPPEIVRRVMPTGALGVSTHTLEQIEEALRGPATYVAFGPVFATGTKETGYESVGLEMVARAAARSDRPLVAIGGITLERAPEVIAAGASAVAVISDLLAGDPASRARAYVAALGG